MFESLLVKKNFKSEMQKEKIILLVDDDPITILLHQRFFAKVGFLGQPTALTNGYEALDFINSFEGDESFFVILDINMPVMNGLEFLSELKSRPNCPKIKIFIVSSSLDASEEAQALSYDFVVDFLSKPLYPQDYQRLKTEYDAV